VSVCPFIEAEKSQRRNVERASELLKVSRAACYAAREPALPAGTGRPVLGVSTDYQVSSISSSVPSSSISNSTFRWT